METSIAVGIAATVLMTLVALIPVSLDTLRDAANTTASARIVQSISADYRMRNWEEVVKQQADKSGTDFYFDGQGTRVKSGDSSAIFTARVKVENAPPLPGAPECKSLKSVEIKLTTSADKESAFANPARHVRTQTLVAQTDRTPTAAVVASK